MSDDEWEGREERYKAAILTKDNSPFGGEKSWKLTEDDEEILEKDNDQVLFAETQEELEAQLHQRHPAPDGFTKVNIPNRGNRYVEVLGENKLRAITKDEVKIREQAKAGKEVIFTASEGDYLYDLMNRPPLWYRETDDGFILKVDHLFGRSFEASLEYNPKLITKNERTRKRQLEKKIRDAKIPMDGLQKYAGNMAQDLVRLRDRKDGTLIFPSMDPPKIGNSKVMVYESIRKITRLWLLIEKKPTYRNRSWYAEAIQELKPFSKSSSDDEDIQKIIDWIKTEAKVRPKTGPVYDVPADKSDAEIVSLKKFRDGRKDGDYEDWQGRAFPIRKNKIAINIEINKLSDIPKDADSIAWYEIE